MLIAYFAVAVWFWGADMLAGELAGVKARPIAAGVLALVWPLSAPFALCASAIIIRRLKSPTPTESTEHPERNNG